MEDEDQKREAAIASAPPLQPHFKPKGGVTDNQLAKFQELHRRRLQIKLRSDIKKKQKETVDGSGKSQGESSVAKGREKEGADEKSSKNIEDSRVPSPKSRMSDFDCTREDVLAPSVMPKKRQKLYWGLDAKERWERKSNM